MTSTRHVGNVFGHPKGACPRGVAECTGCNPNSVPAAEADLSDLALDGPAGGVPDWFVAPQGGGSRQSAGPLKEMSLGTENRVAREAVRLVGDGQMIVDAPYQRGSVWTAEQRQNLVRSYLQGIPVPPITVNDRTSETFRRNEPELGRKARDLGEGSYAVIDGRQRVETTVAWFNGEFGVPASWFQPEDVESTVATPDGPYVTFDHLSRSGQTHMGFRAKLPWSTAQVSSLAEEADLYVLLNTGGTAQSEDDIDNARRYGSST